MRKLRGLKDLAHLLPKFDPGNPQEASTYLAKIKYYYRTMRVEEATFMEALACTMEAGAGLWYI